MTTEGLLEVSMRSNKAQQGWKQWDGKEGLDAHVESSKADSTESRGPMTSNERACVLCT